ncbi:MAG: hypothetical protein FD123_1599 [Bacteroidetes bacterium]|nr:MAG: hypothetical protein FD123_1599 [Bacteroidota bacterium]
MKRSFLLGRREILVHKSQVLWGDSMNRPYFWFIGRFGIAVQDFGSSGDSVNSLTVPWGDSVNRPYFVYLCYDTPA